MFLRAWIGFDKLEKKKQHGLKISQRKQGLLLAKQLESIVVTAFIAGPHLPGYFWRDT